MVDMFFYRVVFYCREFTNWLAVHWGMVTPSKYLLILILVALLGYSMIYRGVEQH